MAGDRIVVMAREPRPGAVKTRLAASVGDAQAAALYAAFLQDTVHACRAAGVAPLISFASDAPSAQAYFARAFPDLQSAPQPDASFGARLAAAMSTGFAAGADRVAIMGSDIPHISPASIGEAFMHLRGADVVLGPTLDGGYWLIAMNEPQPALFEDIDWSSGRELAQTIERAKSRNLRVALIETTFDVDDRDDLDRLRALVARDGPAMCPATAHFLSQMSPPVSAVSAPGAR